MGATPKAGSAVPSVDQFEGEASIMTNAFGHPLTGEESPHEVKGLLEDLPPKRPRLGYPTASSTTFAPAFRA